MNNLSQKFERNPVILDAIAHELKTTSRVSSDNLNSYPVTPSSQEGMKVLADTADTVHLVVPAEIDIDRVLAEDYAYFEELGKLALGACFYEDLPL